jgi:hypothetical protein
MATSAVVYMFDPQAATDTFWYGAEFDSAFLRALSAADPTGKTKTAVRRGDAILHNLASKITSVAETGRGTQHTQSVDIEVYKTIVWDFADALTEQWTSADLETFPMVLASHGIHCITTPTLPTEFRDQVDAGLQGVRGYVGAIELDLGSPLQVEIFVKQLIGNAAIADGAVVLELSWEGHLDTLFEGAQEFKPTGERHVAYGELRAFQPRATIPDELSTRGRVSIERYQGKRQFTLQERVAVALTRQRYSHRTSQPFEISTLEDPSNPLEANLPEAKFLRYLLDEAHPKGGSKAKFFKEALSIGPEDWRYLAAQLHDGLKTAELVELGMKHFEGGYGVSFNAVMPVKGLNGKTVDIDTNWIMEPGQQPRLSTAVPARPRDTTGREPQEPPIVSTTLKGDERWAAIFDLAAEAGRLAATSTVPTPMSISGFGIEMDGLCGFAWVRVPDARRGFARWVIKTDRAYRHYQSGAQIFAKRDSQSVDRARAYATAFAATLRHNGVECEVESRLD